MTPYSENRFYQALENIFVGAQIEGEGGYVNLLKIKNQYYREILQQFKSEVDKEEVITDTFKEEFFDKLYTFFHKYFNESGSVFFVKTAHWQRVYEQVYTDNKDVVLFWKTHMLYYVKSDVLFENMQLTVDDEETKDSYELFFDVSNLKARQNNEKKELVFTFRETQKTSTNVDLVKNNPKKNLYVFEVSYAKGNSKTKLDDLAKKSKIPERVLEKAFSTFKKQSEVDFFINKNAQAFLQEQLNLYLHQTLLNEENAFDQKRLDQLKTIKTFAKKIITFIAQFEDELVRVWNKPKFTLNSNYVITLDKLSNEIIEKLAKHENLQEQIKEWQELGMVDENFDFAKRGEKETFLPIDTKFFKDVEIEILSVFDNIDEALDGRLIHSENYQALNTLQEKYKETVQCIYIDPPFNTGSDFAYVDRFQDSTWLSLMNDRIELARNLLREDGSFYLHLDHNADHLGRLLMDKLYGKDNFLNEITWKRGVVRGAKVNSLYYPFNKDIIMIYGKNHKNVFYNVENSKTIELRKEERYKEYGYKKDEYGYYIDSARNDYTDDSVIKMYDENKVYITHGGNLIIDRENRTVTTDIGKIRIKAYRKCENGYIKEIINLDNVWSDIGGLGNSHDTVLNFETQKPEVLLKRILYPSSEKNSLILDFFTGSATTIATAQKLGRKWLGVEMGDHFSTVALPRMKTVLSGKISGISKELEKEKTLKKGGFFKYYRLEQYEDTLQNMQYQDNSTTSIFDIRKAFEQYIFYADQKFAHVIESQNKSEEIDLNFDRLYADIDFPETISNLLGLPLKAITETSVVLDDHGRDREIRTDYHNMTTEEKLEFVRRLKPLLWWGE